VVLYNNGVRFSCVCPVVDNEFRHDIIKVVYDSAIASGIFSYFDSVMTKFMINNRTDPCTANVNLLKRENQKRSAKLLVEGT